MTPETLKKLIESGETFDVEFKGEENAPQEASIYAGQLEDEGSLNVFHFIFMKCRRYRLIEEFSTTHLL